MAKKLNWYPPEKDFQDLVNTEAYLRQELDNLAKEKKSFDRTYLKKLNTLNDALYRVQANIKLWIKGDTSKPW